MLAARAAIALLSCRERDDEIMNCFNALCPYLLLMREVLEQQGMVIIQKGIPLLSMHASRKNRRGGK